MVGSVTLNIVDSIAAGENPVLDQAKLIASGMKLLKAPRISREDCLIDWNDSVENIFNLISN